MPNKPDYLHTVTNLLKGVSFILFMGMEVLSAIDMIPTLISIGGLTYGILTVIYMSAIFITIRDASKFLTFLPFFWNTYPDPISIYKYFHALYFSIQFSLPLAFFDILLNGFYSRCKKVTVNDDLMMEITERITIWKSLNHGFGHYFLFYFSSMQFMLIVLAFNVITKEFLN